MENFYTRNFCNYAYNRMTDEVIDAENDEILTSEEARQMSGDIFYQLVAPPVEFEPVAKDKPEPLELSAEDEQWWRYNRPYLFRKGKTREQVFWEILCGLIEKVAKYAEKKRRRQSTGYLWGDIEFAWQMLDEAGELLGFAPITDIVKKKVTEDLKDPATRRKYHRRIDRCTEANEVIPVGTLRYRVYSGGRVQ